MILTFYIVSCMAFDSLPVIICVDVQTCDPKENRYLEHDVLNSVQGQDCLEELVL